MGKIETTKSVCDVCGETHFRSSCPNGPHDTFDRLSDDKKSVSHRPDETSSTYETNHSDDWEEQRLKAKRRDLARCQDCGMSESEHSRRDDLFGSGLHVHHKTPARDFDDPADAHFLENLVTLCDSCHKQRTTGE